MNESHVHVSDLRWDRLLAGELAAEAAAAARAEAEACDGCRARLEQITRERDAFATRRVPVRRTRWWRLAAPAALAAAAAAVVLVVRRPSDEAGDRPKGTGPSLELFASSDRGTRSLAAGDRIHAGERLQAAYHAARDGFGAVLARDGGGTANAYVPARGDAMVALPAGELASFPASTVLDDVTGEEIVILLWCESARPLAPLLAELRTSGDVSRPAGCTSRRLVLDKRAGP